jgi:hypothetical protein
MFHSPSGENASPATELLRGRRHHLHLRRGGRQRQCAAGGITFTDTGFTNYAGPPYLFTPGLARAPFPSVPGPISGTRPIPAGPAGDH